MPSAIVLYSFLALAAPSAVHAQAVDPQSIVDANYPISRLHPEEAADRRSCYRVMASAPDGAPLRIVAGYTDTVGAALRVLDRDTSGVFAVSFETPASLTMGGLECTITLTDIDGDASDDVFMELVNGHGAAGWLFRSVQTGLQNITPLVAALEHSYSALNSAAIIDLYHDGSLQLATAGGVLPPAGGRVKHLPEIYKFSGSGMVLDSSVLLIRRFVASDPEWLKITTFNLQEGGSGPYLLRITNGARGGKRRATSISIRINHIQLEGTASLNEQTEFLDIPIPMQLLDENEIEVVLNGATDAHATVVIRSQTR